MAPNGEAANRPFPKAYKHGELRELFDDVFFVSGSFRIKKPMPMSFSRNMTIVRQGGSLTLINSMRLDDTGLAAMDKLGKVENVIRLAGAHGSDDPFYKDRYGAKVWAVKDQPYVEGLGQESASIYFQPDVEMDENTRLPIEGASLYPIKSASPGEGLILLAREGGILISGDSLQNWRTTDRYFSLLAKIMMKRMGFIRSHNIGPAWFKFTKPTVDDMRGILDLEFQHLLPAHGSEVIGDAKEAYRPAIERLVKDR